MMMYDITRKGQKITTDLFGLRAHFLFLVPIFEKITKIPHSFNLISYSQSIVQEMMKTKSSIFLTHLRKVEIKQKQGNTFFNYLSKQEKKHRHSYLNPNGPKLISQL